MHSVKTVRKNVLFYMVLFLGLFGIHPAILHAQTMQALYLDGNGAHATLPPSMFHQFTASTIETWVKWERIHNWSRVFDFGREGNALVVQSEKSSRTLNFAIYDRNGKRHRIQARNAIPVGQWFHVAVTCGPQGMALYLNGQQVGTDPYTGGLEQVTGGRYYLGRSNWPKDKPFQGYLSEFRIWNRQRSQTEIQRTMERRLTGQEPNLIAYWRFDQIQNGQIPSASQDHPARLVQNACLVSVPPIARYLIPGEMEKDKMARQVSAQKKWDQGNFIGAYRDYQAALDLSPGDASLREGLLKALAKSHTKAALLPFQVSNTTNTNAAHRTAYTYLAQHHPAYIEWLTPSTLQFALYEQGISAQSAHQDLINAAKAWHIRLLVRTTIEDIHIDKSRPKRESQKAYLRTDQQTTSDSLKSVRYNIITQTATATGQATLQIIDTQTGHVIGTQHVTTDQQDHIEYADYSGDEYALWSKRGSRYNRLAKREKRFLARKELKTNDELTHTVLEKLGHQIGLRIQAMLSTYTP